MAAAALTSACASGARTNWLGDERWDLVNRPKGAIAVLGDSVGYGLTTVGNVTGRLAQDGWGPLRSYTQLGLHAAPEKPLDPDTVVRWIGEFRARGLAPRAVVVISGANDVGYPAANDVNRNVQRIDTAMKALGNVQVVWTTIHHNRPDLMTAHLLRRIAAQILHQQRSRADEAHLAAQNVEQLGQLVEARAA